MRIKVAQVKIYPRKGALAANLSRLETVLSEIADQEVDVVVTPEAFLDGYVATEKSVTRAGLAEYAVDPATSEYTRPLSRWAKKNKCWILFGCTRFASDGIYNSVLIYNRHGRLAGVYDKVHCQTHDCKYSAGSSLPVFKADFGPFGVMVCADRRWPETVRTLTLKGALVIFNPSYGVHDRKNLCLMQTRSWESEVFIFFTHPGQALATGPTGEVIANEKSRRVDFLITEVDLHESLRVRSGESGHLKDRRPEVYQL